MVDIDILIEGSACRVGKGWNAVPNTILVTEGHRRILVDPGNHPKLLDVLEKRSIRTKDIEIVFLTHSHLDHSLNAGLFHDSLIFDGQFSHEGTMMAPHGGRIPGTDMEIIPTPGHSHDHASLIIRTREGKTAICGDLFWWESGKEQRLDISSLLFLEDPFAVDTDLLISSRRNILGSADLFIPGHGRPFTVIRDQ
ncbi:MAG: MBL fold metallo-hydrolase [Candidatus Thermoplasmatota archaeon]|nr:MBL fold metallo-hydrolase [Candidatus Thermoplasmatota archaeon]